MLNGTSSLITMPRIAAVVSSSPVPNKLVSVAMRKLLERRAEILFLQETSLTTPSNVPQEFPLAQWRRSILAHPVSFVEKQRSLLFVPYPLFFRSVSLGKGPHARFWLPATNPCRQTLPILPARENLHLLIHPQNVIQ